MYKMFPHRCGTDFAAHRCHCFLSSFPPDVTDFDVTESVWSHVGGVCRVQLGDHCFPVFLRHRILSHNIRIPCVVMKGALQAHHYCPK